MKDLLVLLAHLLTTIAKLPGPGGARAIVELKQRNSRFGCRRIAQQIAKAFGIDIDIWQLFMDTPLQQTFSDSDCCMNRNSPPTGEKTGERGRIFGVVRVNSGKIPA